MQNPDDYLPHQGATLEDYTAVRYGNGWAWLWNGGRQRKLGKDTTDRRRDTGSRPATLDDLGQAAAELGVLPKAPC